MNLASLFLITGLSIYSRYFLMSLIFQEMLKSKNVIFFPNQKLNIQAEKRNAFTSSFIFALIFISLLVCFNLGLLAINQNDFSLLKQIFYIGLALLIQETYYYWLHRLMHLKTFYRSFHEGHHLSNRVSAWTSFSFDWPETIIQGFVFILVAFIIPLHLYSIIFLLTVMSLSATINHLNVEIYPRKLIDKFPLKYLIGATHHALHHKEYRTNYGLYFTFWDKWMGTQSKNYEAEISRMISSSRE